MTLIDGSSSFFLYKCPPAIPFKELINTFSSNRLAVRSFLFIFAPSFGEMDDDIEESD